MPKRALKVLDILKTKYGMTDQHFRQIHPMGGAMITFEKYCHDTHEFTPGRNPAYVRDYLVLLLQVLKNSPSIGVQGAIDRIQQRLGGGASG